MSRKLCIDLTCYYPIRVFLNIAGIRRQIDVTNQEILLAQWVLQAHESRSQLVCSQPNLIQPCQPQALPRYNRPSHKEQESPQVSPDRRSVFENARVEQWVRGYADSESFSQQYVMRPSIVCSASQTCIAKHWLLQQQIRWHQRG